MRPMMVRRVAATQKTVDRFLREPFAFGRNDCARMTAMHLRNMGRPVKLAKVCTYHSALGARRALKQLGFDTLSEVMDGHRFVRIPPASAIVGDIIEMPGDDAFGALAVAVGNGRALAYHEDAEGAVIIQPLAPLSAWRVL